MSARKPPKGRPFEKGKSGNPAGRPVGALGRATHLRRYLEATFVDKDGKVRQQPFDLEGPPLTVAEAVDAALVARALAGDTTAIKEIKDTMHGKIKEVHEIVPPDVTESEVDAMDDSEAEATYRKLLKGG